MALLNEISIARASQVPMNESFRVFCHMIKLFVLSSTNKAVTSPSQMNAYVGVQLLSHTNTCIIPENPLTVQLIWVRSSDQNWDKDQFTLGNQVFPQMLDSLESERISCHPYFDLCIRMLTSMRMLNHMNMYSYLDKVQLTRCRDRIFIKELMLKPSLGIPSATWDYHLTSPNITMSVVQERNKSHTHCFTNTLLNPPAHPPLFLGDQW